MNAERAESEGRLQNAWALKRALLLPVCMRWTRGDRFAAEDLLGDAYLRVLESQGTEREVRSPLAYAAAIIANLARDRLRSPSRTELRDSVDSSRWPACEGSAPDELASARQTLGRALEALEQIPYRQRSALLLRSMGSDYTGIANEVGTSRQNARKLVQFARAAVQALE